MTRITVATFFSSSSTRNSPGSTVTIRSGKNYLTAAPNSARSPRLSFASSLRYSRLYPCAQFGGKVAHGAKEQSNAHFVRAHMGGLAGDFGHPDEIARRSKPSKAADGGLADRQRPQSVAKTNHYWLDHSKARRDGKDCWIRYGVFSRMARMSQIVIIGQFDIHADDAAAVRN